MKVTNFHFTFYGTLRAENGKPLNFRLIARGEQNPQRAY